MNKFQKQINKIVEQDMRKGISFYKNFSIYKSKKHVKNQIKQRNMSYLDIKLFKNSLQSKDFKLSNKLINEIVKNVVNINIEKK